MENYCSFRSRLRTSTPYYRLQNGGAKKKGRRITLREQRAFYRMSMSRPCNQTDVLSIFKLLSSIRFDVTSGKGLKLTPFKEELHLRHIPGSLQTIPIHLRCLTFYAKLISRCKNIFMSVEPQMPEHVILRRFLLSNLRRFLQISNSCLLTLCGELVIVVNEFEKQAKIGHLSTTLKQLIYQQSTELFALLYCDIFILTSVSFTLYFLNLLLLVLINVCEFILSCYFVVSQQLAFLCMTYITIE